MTQEGTQHITVTGTHPAPRIAIIGGGAAGFFAAIRAKERNPQAAVTIYERGQKPLAKVAITGGGRCNLTNSFRLITDLRQAYPRGHQLMKRLLRRLDHNDVMEWYERRGVALVTQDDECVFPRSQDAMSIVGCLTHEAKRLSVQLRCGHQLRTLEHDSGSGIFTLTFGGGQQAEADRVAITTGGSPRADGLAYLARLGHDIVQPIPSLFTFNIQDSRLRSLMGTVVDPVSVSLASSKLKSQGALLVTHWGMSGPAILKLSSYAARLLHEQDYHATLLVNWTGQDSREQVEQWLRTTASTHPQKLTSSIHPTALPSRLWQYLTEKAGVPADRKWGELGKKGINRLVETLTNDAYPISGKGTFKEEFVTCGGIALNSINSNTLESKACPGLFFAGEVLDIDAITGGFNLQAAWTTGYVVGESISV